MLFGLWRRRPRRENAAHGAGHDAAPAVAPEIAANIARLGSAAPPALALEGLVARPFAPPTLGDAMALVGAGRSADGLALYERIAAADPACAEAWFRVGLLRLEAGEIASALQAWDRAVAADPRHGEAASLRAVALADLGRNLQAVAGLRQSLQDGSAGPEALVRLGVILGALGWSDSASEVFAQLPEAAAGWWAQARRNAARVRAGHEQRLAELSTPGQGKGFAGRLERARALLSLGRLEACGGAIERMLADRPGSFDVHALKAALLLRTGGAQEAIAYLQALPPPLQQEQACTILLAELLQEAGDAASARLLLQPRLPGAVSAALPRTYALCALSDGDGAAFTEAVAAWLAGGPASTEPYRFAIAASRQSGGVASLHAKGPMPAGAPLPGPIVQFWNTSPPPEDVRAVMASWQALDPAAEHLVFDAQAGRDFIAGAYEPEIAACYDAARHPAMQADIFRLAYLARHGGVYVDADEICRRPLGDIRAALGRGGFAAVLSSEVLPYVHNLFLAAEPGCPIISAALEEAVRLLRTARDEARKPDIWQTTGPGLLTRTVGRFVSKPENRGRVLLLTDQEYRAFCHTIDLAYKGTPEGNWRLA